jgi:hypothetical protein
VLDFLLVGLVDGIFFVDLLQVDKEQYHCKDCGICRYACFPSTSKPSSFGPVSDAASFSG